MKQLADARRVAEVQVQVVDEEQEDPARGVVGRPGRRQDDALLRRRRRRQDLIEHPPAMHQYQRRNFLADAVLQDLEVVLVHVRHELTILVTHDDIRRHQIDGHAEIGWRFLRLSARRGGGRRLRPAREPAAQCPQEPAPVPGRMSSEGSREYRCEPGVLNSWP